MNRIEFDMKPERPYSLSRTAERLVRFTQLVDRMDSEGGYNRCLHLNGTLALMRVVQTGSVARAMLHVTLIGEAVEETAARVAAEGVIRRSLGVGCKLRHFYRTFGEDPLLAESIRTHRGLSLCGGVTLFEAVLTSILAQQVNLKFAYSIYEEIARRYGERLEVDGETFIAFPTPERISRVREPTLRNLKLSGAKAGAIHRIAAAFATGKLVETELEKLSDEEIIARLVAYKGIGRWTAETAMMRGLGRVDVFPAGDLGVIKKIAVEMLGRTEKATEAEMRAFSERWRPFRSLALIYAYAILYGMQPAKD